MKVKKREGTGRKGKERGRKGRTGEDRTGQERTGEERSGQKRRGQDRRGKEKKRTTDTVFVVLYSMCKLYSQDRTGSREELWSINSAK
jgi:hypothetical protein